MVRLARLSLIAAALVAAAGIGASQLGAAEKEKPAVRDYSLVRAAPAPRTQEWADAEPKSQGCVSCHSASDAHTMHRSPAVVLGCTDCHGGNPAVARPAGAEPGGSAYLVAQNRAHVLPRFPGAWHFPASANPARSYALLNREAPEFIRFTNPSDYRVARDACGACHIEIIEAAERSLMASGAMLWGGAAYNNGILPFKNYLVGEAYTRLGEPALVRSPLGPDGLTPEQRARGVLAELYPLPTWHVIPPGDVFRVFERGGRNIGTQFPEIGLPNPTGSIQRLEEPGRPGPAPVQPRPRHRHPRRHPDPQHPQDPPQRPLHVVHGHQRPARRLSPFGLRGLPRRLRQRPRAAAQPHLRPARPRRPDRDSGPDDREPAPGQASRRRGA